MATILVCDGCGKPISNLADLPVGRMFGNQYGECCAPAVTAFLDALDQAHTIAAMRYEQDVALARGSFHRACPDGRYPGE